MLGEQGFVLLHCHVSKHQLETASVHTLHSANSECPQCQGSGEVDQHSRLRKKNRQGAVGAAG
jgi:hypothetical protein